LLHNALLQLTKRKGKRTLLFYDDGSSAVGWDALGEGRITTAEDCPGLSRACLKKDLAGDPNGGYRLFGRPLRRGLTISVMIFHASDRQFGPADRVAIENRDFSGYGFCLTNNCTTLWIERRDRKRPTTLARQTVELEPDRWYKFSLCIGSHPGIYLHVFDESGVRVASIDPVDDGTYSEFDRFVVHGGGTYYLRNIAVERLQEAASN